LQKAIFIVDKAVVFTCLNKDGISSLNRDFIDPVINNASTFNYEDLMFGDFVFVQGYYSARLQRKQSHGVMDRTLLSAYKPSNSAAFGASKIRRFLVYFCEVFF
jgi:hypothetical protein